MRVALPFAKWSRSKTAALLCAAGALILALILMLAQHGQGTAAQTTQYVLQIGPHLFAMLCGLVYACKGRHSSRTRRVGWLLIGAGCLSYCVGDLIYFYYVGVRRIEAPFPSAADVAWTIVFPLIIGGVLSLFGSLPLTGRIRLLFDSAIACSSVAAMGWYFLVEQLWHQSGIGYYGKLVSTTTPIWDMGALFGSVVLLNSASANRNLRRSMLMLAMGIMLWAFADLVYAYSRLHGAFHDGSLTDLGWPLGSIFVGLAALIPFCREEDLSIEDSVPGRSLALAVAPRLTFMFMPYAASLGAFLIILVHDYSDDHRITSQTLIMGLAMLSLVLVRQVFTLLENRQLSQQLVALNDTLEHRVARRTEQLSALLRIYSAITDTLEVEEVLSVTGEQLQAAFGADAVVVWLSEAQEDGRQLSSRHRFRLLAGEGITSSLLRHLERAPLPLFADSLALPLPLFTQNPAEVERDTAPDAHRPLSLSPAFTSEASFASKMPFSETCSSGTPSLKILSAPETTGGYCLHAPLLWRQKQLGTLGIIRRSPNFEATEIDMLQHIGLEAASALENARLYSVAVEMADRDPVTGLLNHRAMHQRLDKMLHKAEAQRGAVVVMMLDLNNFKLFNDTYGHPIGDQVLRCVAEAMRTECPPSALLGRYGGDEFIIAIPDTTPDEAIAAATRMNDMLLANGYRGNDEERVIPITLSFGLSSYPEDSVMRHELLAIADKNLYAAKSSGKSIGRTTAFQRVNRELRTQVSFGLLDSMVTAVDNKDSYTRQHSEDVTEYSLWIGEELGLPEEALYALRVGGLLHDVGKIGVADEILRKPGRLTDEEYAALKRHPVLGALIVGSIPGMEIVVDVVRSHHERWDGRGYPDGLCGEAIPLLGRIAAVADAISAMTTHRPYRRGMEWEVALAEVRANIGTQFDPAAAEAFLRAFQKHRAADTALELPTAEVFLRAA